MLLIADAITVVYLRPALVASGFTEEDVKKICVWYDPSQVATRNDRAADADSGFDRMAVSMEAWRRAHGFSAADAPDAKEVAIRLLVEKGAISPELTEAMINAISPEFMNKIREVQNAGSPAPIPPEIQQALDEAAGVTPPSDETVQEQEQAPGA
jgi:hypothetical protein